MFLICEIRPPASCESPLKILRHLVQCLSIGTQLLTSHTTLAEAFPLHHASVDKGTENIFKSGFPWRSKLLFFTIKRRIERSSQLELASVTYLNCRSGDCCAAGTHPCSYFPFGAVNFLRC
jgi:hypothetical protein